MQRHRGLGREERRQWGKDGGATRLVYLCAFVIYSRGGCLSWFKTNLKNSIVVPDNSPQIFYNDLGDEAAQK
ncbi:MAG: hypothetical protein MMC23_004879 [Stictis urceolatum]|nr:hypothetical protein [Stictis urceolata]